MADHLIERDFPLAQQAENPYQALLEEAIERQALLIAKWQSVGFIHGVMNTDNMLVCGETIDYGPCAFMDFYNPQACFSSIDRDKRYAYQKQAEIAHSNLSCLAQSLMPILDEDEEQSLSIAQAALQKFTVDYEQAYSREMHSKFGFSESNTGTESFINTFMEQMAAQGVDFTQTFRHLADLASKDGDASEKIDCQLPD